MIKLVEFQGIIKDISLDGFIVTNPVNIFYLSGFRGLMPQEREAILVVTSQTATLITARLYQKEAAQVASRDLKIRIADERNQMHVIAQKILTKTKRVGFEAADLKFLEFKEFKKMLRGTRLVPQKSTVENLRAVKTQEEIEKITKAQLISQKAFDQILKTIKVDQTEEEIAHNLSSIIRHLGGQGLAFEPIVATGPNSGLPHYSRGKRKIKKGDILLFDFGAKYQDYCADLSRTIVIGRATDQVRNIFSLVLAAQKKAIDTITNGQQVHFPHQTAVSIFKNKGVDKKFIHGLGHGIGLEVHEKPHLRPFDSAQGYSPKSKGAEKEVLTENMVFSVEPGLYFPWGGVRIEDLVVIKGGKAKVLGQLSADIIEI